MSQAGSNSGAGGPGSGAIFTINDIDPNGSGNFTLTAGANITLTPETNGIIISSAGEGGITVTGDSGTMTGAAVTIYADQAALNSGSSVEFVNSGTTSTLNVTDSAGNTVIGKTAGNAALSSISSSTVGLGYGALNALNSSGNSIVAVGYNCLNAATEVAQTVAVGGYTLFQCTSSTGNTAIGNDAAANLLTGSQNIYLGGSAGSAHTSSESNNVIIDSPGVIGESNALRIGQTTSSASQGLLTAYICGINGNTTGSPTFVTVDTITNQLGVSSGPSGFIETIDGDSGSITGSTVTIYADNAANNAGSSVLFKNSGTLSLLSVSDSLDNTMIGNLAGNLGLTGGGNVALGNSALASNITGGYDTGIGFYALNVCNGGGANVAVGALALQILTTGDDNTAIGQAAGNALTTGSGNTYLGGQAGQANVLNDSYNIYINSPGSTPESNTLRIGAATGTGGYDLTKAFISGINGNTTGSPAFVTVDTITNQLGTASIPSSGISVIDGDAGSITGSSVTIYTDHATNNSGSSVLFKNSGTISLLSVTDTDVNTLIGQKAGNLMLTGSANTGLGYEALTSNITSSNSTAIGTQSLTTLAGTEGGNTAVGSQSLQFLTTNGFVGNVALGWQAGQNLLSGQGNLYLGTFSGANNNGAEQGNIYLQSDGVTGESNCLRVGTATGTGGQELSTAYISGINGNTSSNPVMVTINTSTDQLGTFPMPQVAPSTTYVFSSPYQVLATDDIILCDTVLYAAPMSVTLIAAATPPPQDGQVWTIKDWSGGAATFPITITVTGGTNIDGTTSYVLNQNYQAVSIAWSALEATYSVVYNYSVGSGGSVTIAGDTGSISGSSLTIFANQASYDAGGTVGFVNSGTTSTFSVTDANSNTTIGKQTGNGTISGNYNVGLGTESLEALTSGTGNISLGHQTLQAVNSGSSNIGLGVSSLQVLQTGNQNIGIGVGTLSASVADNNNIAIGQNALTAINGASNNIAIGYLALSSSVTDIQNTAIGWGCMTPLNGGGGSNTGVGFQVLNGAVTTAASTGIGVNALLTSSTGYGNTAVGVSSLQSSTADGYLVAVGYQALETCNGGVNLVAVGANALQLSVADQDNTACGIAALGALNGGSSNTAIGANAGLDLLTGSYNLILGSLSGGAYSGAETSNTLLNSTGVLGESNTLHIGSGTGTGPQQLSAAFISGINGITSSNALMVTINSATDQLGVQAIPSGGSFPWTDEATSFTAVVSNGYFCSAALTATLPTSPTQGQQVNIAVDTSGTVIVQAATGQTIRIGAGTSTSGGTATNHSIGDALQLVFRSADSVWFSVSSDGSWTLA